MTAEELITQLQTLPPDTPVLVEGYENGFDEAIDLTTHEVVRYRHAQPWDGQYQPPDRFKEASADVARAAVILGCRRHLR